MFFLSQAKPYVFKRITPLLLGVLTVTALSCSKCSITSFSGDKAFTYVEKIVSFGSRLPGSEGSVNAYNYIFEELDALGLEVSKQKFEAQTPIGALQMTNVIAKIPGNSSVNNEEKIIVIGTHYDTKYLPDISNFVGANDGGSGSGILLAMAGVLKNVVLKNSVWIVFFDGEESFLEQSSSDWFYGSKYFVQQLLSEGKSHTVKSMVLLDMVGDKDFKANQDLYSTKALVDKTRSVAKRLGYGGYFFGDKMYVSDDHKPFLEIGIPAIDIIDFEYGGNRSPGEYWHTAQDTLDKVSPITLKIVGDVAVNLICELDKEI